MAIFKLTLEYNGTAYAGWQRQPDRPTVQAVVEAAVEHVIHQQVPVIGAGRTDAGVHALGQVASFRLIESGMGGSEWLRALNALLPADISVLAVEEAPHGFHARYSAKGKLYEYRILNQRERSALEYNRAWHVRKPLDIPSMRQAAAQLLDRHDFSSFQGHPTDTESPICDLRRLDIIDTLPLIRIQVEADRFLKQMVRAIVGTLVEVGQGKRPPDSLKSILDSKDRREGGQTAPAHGLYLVRVDY